MNVFPRAGVHRVLDIGCGTGLGYELLQTIGLSIDYVGLDVSGGMLRLFKERRPSVRTVEGSGDNLSALFGPHEFDFVMSINAACSFVPDTNRMVHAAFKVLTPGGGVYLSFLNRWSLRRILRLKGAAVESYRSRGDRVSGTTVRARTYTARGLRQLLGGAGFIDVSCLHRSVLGGVWESARAVRFERMLMDVAPRLGHTIAVIGKRAE